MTVSLKALAGETIVYGFSTMLGRLLNWLLMPFYIRTLLPEEYGVIINIYGIISILLVIFTFGLETGFFRFSRKGEQADVYKTLIVFLGLTSLVSILMTWLLSNDISRFYYAGNYNYSIILISVIVAFDSFLAIPFANLRLNNQSVKFGIFKISNIILNILFNLIFLLIIPILIKNDLLNSYFTDVYNLGNGVFYVLLSNALSSLLTSVFFLKEFFNLRGFFQYSLLVQLLKYSWPVLVVGITGMLIQNSDKILMPRLLGENGFKELAVYGANFKIGVLMTLFTQSFRFAFEPYFFKIQEKGKEAYASIMEYFIFFGVSIFLGVMLSMDVINLLLTKEYLYGNIVIPFVLLGQLFYGIYFNLSLWYKLSDKTVYGAIFGVFGTAVTVSLLFLLIPAYGIIGGALSIMVGYGLMVIVSFFLGQKHYPVPYSLKRIFLICISGGVAYLIHLYVDFNKDIVNYLLNAVIFVFFIGTFFVIKKYVRN